MFSGVSNSTEDRMEELIENFQKKLFSHPKVKSDYTLMEQIEAFYYAVSKCKRRKATNDTTSLCNV